MASLPGRAGGGGGSDRDNADKNCKKKLPPARDDEGERETSPKRSRPINLPFTPPPRAPYTGGIPVFNPPRRPREPARRADFADADNDEQLSEYFVANRHRTRPIDIPSGGRRREEEGSDGEGKDWPPLAHSPGTGMMEILAMSPASRLLAQGLARQSPALRTRRRVVSDAVGFPAPIAGDVFYSPAGVPRSRPRAISSGGLSHHRASTRATAPPASPIAASPASDGSSLASLETPKKTPKQREEDNIQSYGGTADDIAAEFYKINQTFKMASPRKPT